MRIAKTRFINNNKGGRLMVFATENNQKNTNWRVYKWYRNKQKDQLKIIEIPEAAISWKNIYNIAYR